MMQTQPAAINNEILQQHCIGCMPLTSYIDVALSQAGLAPLDWTTTPQDKHGLEGIVVYDPIPSYRWRGIDCYMGYRELVHSVIEKWLDQHRWDQEHVLVFGYRKKVPGKTGLYGNDKLECYYPNTILNYIITPAFTWLHSAVGDEMMIHILYDCLLFQPLQKDSFIQISGRVLYQWVVGKSKPTYPSLQVPSDIQQVLTSFSLPPLTPSPPTPVKGKKEIPFMKECIPRTPLFYASLSTKHIGISNADFLYTLDECMVDAKKLMMSSIFIDPPGNIVPSSLRVPPSLYCFKSIALEVIENSKLHPSAYPTLKRYCGIPPYVRKVLWYTHRKIRGKSISFEVGIPSSTGTTIDGDMERRVYECMGSNGLGVDHIEPIFQAYTRYDRVERYVWKYISKIVPTEAFGSDRNVQQFRKGLYTFITLGRYENVMLVDMMRGFHCSDIDWYGKPLAKRHKRNHTFMIGLHKRVGQFFFWIYTHIVIPVLKSSFYITDSSTSGQVVHYYRIGIWKLVRDFTMVTHGSFLRISRKAALQLLSRREMSSAKVRFIAKSKGRVRPIMNLSYVENVHHRKKKSINTILQGPHCVLKHEYSKYSHQSSSVCSFGDIYSRLHGFKAVLSQRYGEDTPPLYVVSLDISKAFDTIDQDTLMQEVLGQGDLFLEKAYRQLRYVSMNMISSQGRVLSKWERVVSSVDYLLPFPQGVEDHVDLKRGSIWVDQVKYPEIRTEEIMVKLKELVKATVVKNGGEYYRLIKGIPQGSILSTLLCSMYFDYLETHVEGLKSLHRADYLEEAVYKPVFDPVGILLRFVDDWLYVTTSKSQAVQFIHTMHGDMKPYGIEVNPEKTSINFDYTYRGIELRKVGGSHGLLHWCGILLDPMHLHVEVEGYQGEIPLHQTLSVGSVGHPGWKLREKLLGYIRPKIQMIMLSPMMNSWRQIDYNIFMSFLMAGKKLCSHMSKLARLGYSMHNDVFVVKVLGDCISFTSSLISIRMRTIGTLAGKGNSIRIPFWRVRLLGYYAFYRIFHSHRPFIASILLPCIQEILRAHPKMPRNLFRRLITDNLE